MSYKLAANAYEAEKTTQSHLWGRFRDSVQLVVVVSTGHAAAILALASSEPEPWLAVPGIAMAILSFVPIVWSVFVLGKVFQGDDYWDQKPAETQRVLKGNADDLALVTLNDLAEELLNCANSNYEINKRRGKLLSCGRTLLLVSLFMLFPVWLAVFASRIIPLV